MFLAGKHDFSFIDPEFIDEDLDEIPYDEWQFSFRHSSNDEYGFCTSDSGKYVYFSKAEMLELLDEMKRIVNG